jgi:hypothetical protein
VKVFGCFLCLFWLCGCPLFSQIEEIPELETENLQDNWLNQFYAELETGRYNFGCNSRTKYQDEDINSFADIQFRQHNLRFNLNLYQPHKAERYANFQLSFLPSRNNFSEIHFGSYRPAFALGTIFKKSGNESLFKIERAAHPVAFSPFGIAAIWRLHNLSTFFIASDQNRKAVFQEGKIKSLTPTVSATKPFVQENLLAAGIEYRYKNSNFAALAYRQNYDRDFADTLLTKNLKGYSLAAITTGKNYTLTAETSLLKENIAFQTTAEFSYYNVSQEIRYAYWQGKQIPTYSAKPCLLSSQGENQEIDWELNYLPQKNVLCGMRYALIRKNNGIKSPNWNSRTILYLTLKPAKNIINLQLTRLDREIVTTLDSSYISTLPAHYRLRCKIESNIHPKLSLALLFRYHYEDKKELHKNSFYWENSVHLQHKKLDFNSGIKTWQTLNTLILPDPETENPAGFTTATSEDDRIFAELTFKGKLFTLKTELQQSWLNGNRTLYLSLRI